MNDTTSVVESDLMGLYENLSNETYHADKTAISSTTLKEARRSAAHLKAKLDGNRPMSGRHLLLGNAIHAAVLEPELFDKTYAVAPSAEEMEKHMPSSSTELLVVARKMRESLIGEVKKNNPDALEDSSVSAITDLCRAEKIKGFSGWKGAAAVKEGYANAMHERGVTVRYLDDLIAQSPAAAFATVNKASKAELKEMIRSIVPDVVFQDEAAEAHLEGMTELTEAEWAVCQGIREAVLAHPRASKLLTGGVAETSVFYTHEGTGKKAKVRSDYYREDLGVIADIKSCDDARPDAAMRAIYNYGYHISAAMYLDGYRSAGFPAETFVWVFCEKQAPFGVRVYVASPELLERGAEEYNRYMDIYAHGLDTGEWPGYAENFEAIDLPAWAK